MRRLPRNFHSHEHGSVAAPPQLMLFAAHSVLPFLRSPLGYDIVHPLPALRRTLALILLPLVFWWFYIAFTNKPPPADVGQFWMAGFAALSFIASSTLFVARARGQRRGEELHTAEAGYSWLSWNTDWPVPLCEQVIIPVALAANGWGIAQTFSFDLGWWLVICGASYFLMANWEHRRRFAQTRTTVDDMMRAQTFGERLDGHEQQARNARKGRGSGSSGTESAFQLLGSLGLAAGDKCMSLRRLPRCKIGLCGEMPALCIIRRFFAGAYCPDAPALNQPRSIELSVPLLPDPQGGRSGGRQPPRQASTAMARSLTWPSWATASRAGSGVGQHRLRISRPGLAAVTA